MAIIPPFQSDGMLPPSEYEVSFDELRRSVLVSGPVDSVEPSSWHKQWREQLVDNLEILVRQLWSAGIREVFADGSFAEDNDHPNDIDGYFVCNRMQLFSGQLERQLNQLPFKVWTWDPASRWPYRKFSKPQLPMWHRYRVELYAYVPGLGSGIFDRYGYELKLPEAFRQSRTGKPRGILKIMHGGQS